MQNIPQAVASVKGRCFSNFHFSRPKIILELSDQQNETKTTQGEVSMTLNYSLTDKEVASGLVLTCQAHPKTDRVVVDFDDIW
ncbi:MAG: hypothetical protein K9G46_02570 [Flavobacteriales bacterium]|nr:hypothetical protein [Flavobacteriales bacterium]